MEKELKEYFDKNNWKTHFQNDFVEKEYVFKDFIKAFTWMTSIAFYAEKLNHHPDWENTYNKIKVNLKTHDQGKVTVKDLELAEIMDFTFENN